MTGPMSGVPAVQPKLMEQGAPQQIKQSDSKFDAVLADKAQGVGGPDSAAKAQSVAQAEPARQVDGVAKTDKPTLNMVSHVIQGLEQGHDRLEQLIQAGASGKNFSNGELLSLQASMYKYTMELDLTSKVVEKATSGLKDLTKTQV
jgi:hypothetical protein